jgi:hypothetical protein
MGSLGEVMALAVVDLEVMALQVVAVGFTVHMASGTEDMASGAEDMAAGKVGVMVTGAGDVIGIIAGILVTMGWEYMVSVIHTIPTIIIRTITHSPTTETLHTMDTATIRLYRRDLLKLPSNPL